MLLSKEIILQNQEKFKPIACIYFLIKNNEIVYVGQTIDLYARLSAHSREKDFDAYSFVECNIDELDALEILYIVKFKPKYNTRLPNNPYFKTLKQIKQTLGCSLRTLKKIIRERDIKPIWMDYYDIRKFQQ